MPTFCSVFSNRREKETPKVMGRFEQLVWLPRQRPGMLPSAAFPLAMLLSFYCKLLVFFFLFFRFTADDKKWTAAANKMKSGDGCGGGPCWSSNKRNKEPKTIIKSLIVCATDDDLLRVVNPVEPREKPTESHSRGPWTMGPCCERANIVRLSGSSVRGWRRWRRRWRCWGCTCKWVALATKLFPNSQINQLSNINVILLVNSPV